MWKNININKQNIKAETGKAVLIQMPHNSKYDGFSFWHPTKLLRNGKHGYSYSLGYTDDFSFKLIKYGAGQYNSKEIIKEITINSEEFEIAFGVMNENIKAPEHKSLFETHKPSDLQPVASAALDELKDE